MRTSMLGALLAAAVAAAPWARAEEAPLRGVAYLHNGLGNPVGMVLLEQTPRGVLMAVHLANLPPGVHGFHVHEVGACIPPGFESAGGHFDPYGSRHGFRSPEGAHAGDLPNLHVPETGSVAADVLARGLTLAGGPGALLDTDGAAIVVHAEADDYESDPAGAAGGRFACGIVQRVR